MAATLFVVALAMIVGGAAAAYLGADIIVMERGWTMVIAGTVTAASGVLLAGLAAVLARLKRIQAEFLGLGERFLSLSPVPPSPNEGLHDDDPRVVSESRTHEPTSSSATEANFPAPPALAADVAIAPSLPAEEIAPPVSLPPVDAAPVSLPPIDDAPRARVLARITAGNDPEVFVVPAADDPPIVGHPPVDPSAELPSPELGAGETERDSASTPELASETPPEATRAEPDSETAPTIVGTYNSGGNFYVMYSDGSIEADTPAGKFRFDSLDELKAFIAAGGDKAKTPA